MAQPTKKHAQQPSSSRVVARNAVFRSGGDAVAKVASVVFYVAVARELGEKGFGDFIFALSFTGVLILAAGFGTEDLVAREVARDHRRVHQYLSDAVALKVIASVALLLVAALVVNLLGYSANARMAVYIVGVAVAIENLGRSWHSVFQAYEQMGFISLGLILQRVSTAVAGLAVLLLGGRLLAVSLVYLGGTILGFSVQYWTLRRYVVRPRVELDRSRWWPIVKASIPIGLVGVLFTLLLKVDQSLLSFVGGGNNAEVGFYGAAFRLVETTMFIPWGFGMAMLPWFARHEERDAAMARGYGLGLKLMLGLLVPIGLVYALLGDSLINLLYGARYADAVLPLRMLGAATVFYAINSLAATVLIARDRPGTFSRLLVGVAVLNIAMNLILIPPYGAGGAAFTAAVSGLLLAVLSVRCVTTVVGRVSLLRALAGPTLAGLAMTAAILPFDLPLVPAAAAGTLAYAAVLAGFERLAYPDDFAAMLRLLKRRAGPRPHAGDSLPGPPLSEPELGVERP